MTPGRLPVRFAAICGFVTGAVLVLAGLAAAIGIPAGSSSLASGAAGLAEGIGGAEDAVRVLGQDFEQSSSLLGAVSSSIGQTSLIAGETRTALEHARNAGSQLVTACTLTAGDLESISSRLGPLIGPTNLASAAGHLRAASEAGTMTMESMDSLGIRLSGLEAMLAAVAGSVDSLGTDLAATRSTMEDAGARLASLRVLAEKSSSAALVSAAGFILGLAFIFLGLQQVVLSTLLLRLQPFAERPTSPSPGGDPGRG
jgi:hypothetical protein